MPSFGTRSRKNLKDAHHDLQRLFHQVVKNYDCAVIEGFRSKERQDELFHAGKSQLEWPGSKHNLDPSFAVDVIPYPVSWTDYDRFYHFGGYVKGVADAMGINIRWGGDWDRDNNLIDQSFFDMPHFELYGYE